MSAALDRMKQNVTDALASVDAILATADSEDRDPSEAEVDIIRNLHADIERAKPGIDELEAVERSRTEHLARIPVPVQVTRDGDVQVADGVREVYRTFAQYARDVIITRHDGVMQMAGGPQARAAAQERVDRVVANTLTSDVPGLIPPQYLSTFAEAIGAQRPIVSAARTVSLTSGKLSYPSITQRPQVGKQTTEKTEGPSRKMTVVFVDVLADTYMGVGDLSWQTLQWSTPDALTLWFDLAAEEYARQTESAAGTVLAALPAGVTVATNDLQGWIGAIAAASGAIYGGSHRMADTIFADVGRGYSIISMVSAQAPVFLPGGNFSLGSGQGAIAGLRLVISYGLPANTVVVGVANQLLCAETSGAPVELRAVEPAIGGLQVGIIGAFAAKVVEAAAFNKLVMPA